MKRKTLLLYIITTVAVACSNERSSNKLATVISHSNNTIKDLPDTTSLNNAEIKNHTLHAIYHQYQLLTSALTKNDALAARVAALAIEAGANQLPEGRAIVHEAVAISETQNIEKQRMAYSKLSQLITNIIKTAGLKNGQLYVQYCTMAFNDKGAIWLSEAKDIINPYFGNQMLTCGHTKEIIK